MGHRKPPVGEGRFQTVLEEIIELRKQRGLSVERVRKYAPTLMRLPAVDAEMQRRHRSEEERAQATVAVIWCLVENGDFDRGAQDLLRTTLNFEVSQTRLGQRRSDLYARLKTYDNVKQYAAYEKDVYGLFVLKLEQAERSPCDTGGGPPGSPGPMGPDIERARRGIRGLLEVGIVSFFYGESDRAYEHLREIIEEFAPKAAQRFFPPSFDFKHGWVALLRALAGSIYPDIYKFQREGPGMFLAPPDFLEFMPSLLVLLTRQTTRTGEVPPAVRHLSRGDVLDRLDVGMDDIDELVRDTAQVVADLILDREEYDGWERSIAAALQRPEQPAATVTTAMPPPHKDSSTTEEAPGRSAFEAGA